MMSTSSFDYDLNDTIAAVATAASDAGIGIIRISGPNSGPVIETLFRRKISKEHDAENGAQYVSVAVADWKANTIHYGYIIDPDSGLMLDEVLVSWMKSPHSYTTEDTAEINTHGGIMVMQSVLNAVFRAGARPAQPGEFTKRAFLSGRMDLSEAEAVMDLIHARSEFGYRSALSQLSGSLSSYIRHLRDVILYEIAFIEAALDDPDNYSLDGYDEKLDQVCLTLSDELSQLLDRSEQGLQLLSGIPTAIVGRPNVGKSSLMNYLAGSDKSIVTDIPGTTRDVLEADIDLKYDGNKITLRVMDTAGIHQTFEKVEAIGVERAIRSVETAQLILFVVDGSVPLTQDDYDTAEAICDHRMQDSHCILLLNKVDLPSVLSDSEWDNLRAVMPFISDADILRVSCYDGRGMDCLQCRIGDLFHVGELTASSDYLLTGERQICEIRTALHSLDLTRESIHNHLSEDFYSIDLMNAYTALGHIIGESVEDDLVDKIFSEFCLGK